jgi:hypothetical protein
VPGLCLFLFFWLRSFPLGGWPVGSLRLPLFWGKVRRASHFPHSPCWMTLRVTSSGKHEKCEGGPSSVLPVAAVDPITPMLSWISVG